MDIRKKLKGPDIDWASVEYETKDPRPITLAKKNDLIKMMPLLSKDAQNFYVKLLDLPVNEILDDVDMLDSLEDELE